MTRGEKILSPFVASLLSSTESFLFFSLFGSHIIDIWTAGEIVAEGYTDENGIAKFTLRYGKYTYEEFAALDGYIRDTEKYPFEIKEDGEIVKAAMTNEKIPDVPQTGDESNIGFWIGLAAVAIGGVIATAIILIKKKKDDENE